MGPIKPEEMADSINFEQSIGRWIWYYSKKKNEFFPYGIIVEYSDYFVKVKSREHANERNEYAEFTRNTINKWIRTEKAYLSDEGHFVKLSDYV